MHRASAMISHYTSRLLPSWRQMCFKTWWLLASLRPWFSISQRLWASRCKVRAPTRCGEKSSRKRSRAGQPARRFCAAHNPGRFFLSHYLRAQLAGGVQQGGSGEAAIQHRVIGKRRLR